MTARKLPPHSRIKGNQIEAYAYVHRRQVSKRFPLDTDRAKIIEWQTSINHTAARADAVRRRTRRAGTLETDVQTYITEIGVMYPETVRAHLNAWIQVYGEKRRRTSISTAEINATCHAWIDAGVALQTVIHRRNALARMIDTLDGPGAANPARAVKLSAPAWHLPPPVDYATAHEVLDELAPSASRARLRVLLTTGIPPAVIKTIKRSDLNLDAEPPTLIVAPRRKGKGAEARELPLTVDGIAALRELAQLGAFGSFATVGLWQVFKRARERYAKKHPKARAALDVLRPYDLRHIFGSLAYESSEDPGATARLMLHADERMIARYTKHAQAKVDASATRKIDRAVGAPEPPRKKARAPRAARMYGKPHGKQAKPRGKRR